MSETLQGTCFINFVESCAVGFYKWPHPKTAVMAMMIISMEYYQRCLAHGTTEIATNSVDTQYSNTTWTHDGFYRNEELTLENTTYLHPDVTNSTSRDHFDIYPSDADDRNGINSEVHISNGTVDILDVGSLQPGNDTESSSVLHALQNGSQTFIILLLSALVLLSLFFTMFVLFSKAEAHNKGSRNYRNVLLDDNTHTQFPMTAGLFHDDV